MRQEIKECLDLGTDLSHKVLTERLIEYMKSPNEQEDVKMERQKSIESKHKICDLPLQDTFWLLKKLNFRDEELSSFRVLALFDAGLSHSSAVQFSLVSATNVLCGEQALQIVYQGCLFPLDGRKPRRPRFLYLDESIAARDVLTGTEEVGIRFCGSLPSPEEVCSLRESYQRGPHCRQCAVCGISATPDLFHTCDSCDGAVLYCSNKCQLDEWRDFHQDWCLQFKQYMTLETELANLPFPFISETTGRDFDNQKLRNFLQKFSADEGLWRIECPQLLSSLSNNDPPSAEHSQCKASEEDAEWIHAYKLDRECSVLQRKPPPLQQSLSGWSDYYTFRGFHTESLIAVLLHFPLTLYYIVSQRLPTDFCETSSQLQESKKICIHLIGAEKEVEMFLPFLEFARLLMDFNVDLHLFGNNFDGSYHDQTKTRENLHFHIHKTLYHRANHQQIPLPHVAVCFNGGIGAYSSYVKTVRRLTGLGIPFYYTDYGQASIAVSRKSIIKYKVGHVSEPLINPFRSPLRMSATDQNLPRYSNAFMSVITDVAR